MYKGISRAEFKATLWRYWWRHHHENGIILDGLFISEVKLKLCLIVIFFFKMAAILSSRQTFLPEVIPEVEYTIKIDISISDILSFWSML